MNLDMCIHEDIVHAYYDVDDIDRGVAISLDLDIFPVYVSDSNPWKLT